MRISSASIVRAVLGLVFLMGLSQSVTLFINSTNLA